MIAGARYVHDASEIRELVEAGGCDIDKAAILAELDVLADIRPMRADEVSLKDLAEHWGMTRVGAQHRLKRMVADGRVVTRIAYDPVTHRSVRVYTLPK